MDSVGNLVSEFLQTPGYAGAVVSENGSLLTLYWKGPPPPAVAEAMASAAIRCNVTASLREAQFEAAELENEAARLALAHSTSFPRIVMVAPSADGSHLAVKFATGTLAEASRVGVDCVEALSSRGGTRATLRAVHAFFSDRDGDLRRFHPESRASRDR